MTDQLTEVRVITLDELRYAIDAVPEHPGPCIPGQNIDRWVALLHEHRRWALEAWRMAFEWREDWRKRLLVDEMQKKQSIARRAILVREGDEGLRLIREKLQ